MKHVSNHSESIPTKKKFFDQNFLPLSFFRYFGHFRRKTTKSHEKKFYTGKTFRFRDFGLKYVLKRSESISTKIFWLCHFFTILVILGKKWLSTRKNFKMGKICDFEAFVLNTFQNIPTKNFFRPKFFDFAIFHDFLAQNHVFRGFRGQKIFFEKKICASF